MVPEDTWYRVWNANWTESKIVSAGILEELEQQDLIEYAESETFYDSAYGLVTVDHYVHRWG